MNKSKYVLLPVREDEFELLYDGLLLLEDMYNNREEESEDEVVVTDGIMEGIIRVKTRVRQMQFNIMEDNRGS